jgi:hypothetical protein
MANLNKLVITAADYKVILIVPTANGSVTFTVLTLANIGWDIKRDSELIYAVGDTGAIANKSNGVAYTGKLNMQAGEMGAILALCGFTETTEIQGATLGITSLTGGISRTFDGLNFNSENLDIKAKDKESLISTDWTALTVV